MMNKLFTLLLAAACFTASAQVQFPWNPDSNGDGEIGVDDLLGMLSSFGQPWELPDPTIWATESIQNLLAFQDDLESMSDSLSSVEASLSELQSALQLQEENLAQTISDQVLELTDSLSAENNTLASMLASAENSADSLQSLVGLEAVDLRGNQSENQGYANPMFFDLSPDVELILTTTSLNGHAKVRLPQSDVTIGHRVTLKVSGSISYGQSARSWNLQTLVDGEWQSIAGWSKTYASYNTQCYPYDCAGGWTVRVEYTENGWVPVEFSPEIIYWSEE